MDAMQTKVNLVMFVVMLVFLIFWGLIWWRIFKKAGYHGALGLLCFIPGVNIAMLAILAFSEWPIYKKLNPPKEGEAKSASSLSKPLIVVIIIAALVPILALLAAIAIPNFLRARIAANEKAAQYVIESVGNAIKNYTAAHEGKYPQNESDLVDATPPYLSQGCNDKIRYGHIFSLTFSSDNYELTAIPEKCGKSGTKIFMGDKKGIRVEKCDQ